MAVKMDYKNDIFFGDRKYKTVGNDDGSVSFKDVTTYQQVGDTFGAGDLNKLAAAVNGLETKTTAFGGDGSITETDSQSNVKHTVFNADGSITETLTTADGVLIATKTTVFNQDGTISEAVT